MNTNATDRVKMRVPPSNMTQLRAYLRVRVDQPRLDRIFRETLARCGRFSRQKRKREIERAGRRIATCITVETTLTE